MRGVSGDAFDAVEHQLLQVGDLLALGEKARRQQRVSALFEQAVERGRGLPSRNAA